MTNMQIDLNNGTSVVNSYAEVLVAWSGWLTDALSRVSLPLEPKAARDKLCQAFSDLATAKKRGRFLILAFGSVARLEPAKDLDLIIVDGTSEVLHHAYGRIVIGKLQVDLNVVSSAWLQNAWKDVEWGYWISESYPLLATDEALEEIWRHHVNFYWSPAGIRRRAVSHHTITRELVSSCSLAYATGRPLLARLLAHEAGRSLVFTIIDRHGDRVFCHRSLRSEFNDALTRGNIQKHLPLALFDALLWDHDDDGTRFVELRRRMSALQRSTDFIAITGCNPGQSRIKRFGALAVCAKSDAGKWLETLLVDLEAEHWLPQPTSLGIADADLNRLLPTEGLAGTTGIRPQTASSVQIIPTFGDIEGTRWASYHNGRLKLIVNTGGCKTPSCHFCTLPSYGRALPRTDLPQTLDAALAKYQPSELALYNDGNFFNCREIPVEVFDQVCQTIRRYHVDGLVVESIPRFVTRHKIAALKNQSNVRCLTVALGMQSVGNFFSIPYLGRPDVDALFDLAIDQIHAADADVRLYLLWHFGPASLDVWEERLAATLAWGRTRGVERISICHYRPPILTSESVQDSIAVNRLRDLVGRLSDNGITQVEIVNEGLASCTPATRNQVF